MLRGKENDNRKYSIASVDVNLLVFSVQKLTLNITNPDPWIIPTSFMALIERVLL